ncbi:YceI family protein [Caulobacter mirabilis]|uniref:Polyisoprenoid-binding protein n=1 Tax=Caulobacter mirabilis TaxID=69666 RepID=A0A2D2B1X1_9CAUL|nr:YceI family protein [Caulobacter mirabilis]ATQ44243.1 polyisoprenoid-binding protein [Caulobacter mirabilis]
MLRPVAAALALVLISTPMAALAAPSTNPADMPAGTYVLDGTHASLLAKVRHLGFSNYTVRFTVKDATYSWDPKSPQTAQVTALIDAKSFDTGYPGHDPKLANEFIAADKFPEIKFVSTSIQQSQGGKGKMTGDLTLRGVTKPVTLDVTYNGYGEVMGSKRSGFSAATTIKRSDFGSDFLNKPGMIGDDIDIVLELEFTKK